MRQITLPDNSTSDGEGRPVGHGRPVPAGQNGGGGNGSGTPTIPSTSASTTRTATGSLDQAPVQVDNHDRGVESALSVPVTALVGKSGGGFAVEVVRAGGRRELVAVKLGLFDTAGGRVQVEGDLREGDQVVVPSL